MITKKAEKSPSKGLRSRVYARAGDISKRRGGE